MIHNKNSIVYGVVTLLSLPLIYLELTEIISSFSIGIYEIVSFSLFALVLLLSGLIAFGKLKSNKFINTGIILTIFISIFKYKLIFLCSFVNCGEGGSLIGILYLLSVIFPFIYPVSLTLLIVGYFNGRKNSLIEKQGF